MAPLLLIGGLTLASLPALLRRVGRRLAASEWAQLCVVAMVAGAVLVELGALLWAAPTVLRAAGVDALAMACEQVLGPLQPLGVPGGLVGILLATALPVLAWESRRRTRAQADALAIEPELGRHEQRVGFELVVLPTNEPLAYSVDEGVPQVVISQGLCDALTDDQLAAVVSHEQAHLAHRHPQLLSWAALAAAALRWWPHARSSNQALRAGFERWADDGATAGRPERRLALRDALLAVVMADAPQGVAAFSLAEATAERIEAMDTPPRASLAMHAGIYLPGAAAFGVAVGAMGGWIGQMQAVLAMAGRCPL